jgi:hypothetical protein
MIGLVILFIAAPCAHANDDRPSAAALIERFTREKSPVWADGETATFFFRGAALKVEVIAGGDQAPGRGSFTSSRFGLPRS